MQLTNSPTAKQFQAIEKAIQSERLARYLPAAGKNKTLAFRYYLWNCALSESFYLPIHFSEVLCRNAIHRQLVFRLGEKWYEHTTFRNLLDPKFRSELDGAIADERAQHSSQMTNHHVVSALHFGFWEHLTTKRFERLIWHRGIGHNFPGAHFSKNRQDLHDLIESVRRWRNRIAHHNAIFDKSPSRKLQDTMDLIKWVCADTSAWLATVCTAQAVLNARPTEDEEKEQTA